MNNIEVSQEAAKISEFSNRKHLKEDVVDLTSGIGHFVWKSIVESNRQSYKPPAEYSIYDAKDQEEKTSSKYVIDFIVLLTIECHIEIECLVIAWIYLEKMMNITNQSLRLYRRNWKSLVFTAIMVSCKMWDDLTLPGADFKYVYNLLVTTRSGLRKIEIKFLQILSFNLVIKMADYSKTSMDVISSCIEIDELPYEISTLNLLEQLNTTRHKNHLYVASLILQNSQSCDVYKGGNNEVILPDDNNSNNIIHSPKLLFKNKSRHKKSLKQVNSSPNVAKWMTRTLNYIMSSKLFRSTSSSLQKCYVEQ